MSINKIIEFAGAAPESDKNTNELDLSRGFPSRLHPARQWFNYLFNTVTKKINEIIDEKLDVDANAVSASKLQTQRTVSFNGDATGSFDFDGSQNESTTLTLANSGVSANTYGGVFKIPVVTVNAKGLVTEVGTQDIQDASTTQKGVAQLALSYDVLSGIDVEKVITPAALKAAFNHTVNGANEITIPMVGGLLLKIGTSQEFTNSNDVFGFNFATPFPNNCLQVMIGTKYLTGVTSGNEKMISLYAFNKSSINIYIDTFNQNIGSVAALYWAIGN